MAFGAAGPGPGPGYPRPHGLGQPTIRFPGSYGGAVDGYRTQVLLADLGGVLFSFDHEHRLNVLGECLGLPPARVDELLWQSGFSAACDAGRYRDAAAIRAQIRRITGYAGLGGHVCSVDGLDLRVQFHPWHGGPSSPLISDPAVYRRRAADGTAPGRFVDHSPGEAGPSGKAPQLRRSTRVADLTSVAPVRRGVPRRLAELTWRKKRRIDLAALLLDQVKGRDHAWH